MPEPRYQRRKEDRPAEITEAAFETFAEKGYASARVEEVAKRAVIAVDEKELDRALKLFR